MASLVVAMRNNFNSFVNGLIVNFKFDALGYQDIITDNLDSSYNETELPPMSGRVAIVTGGSRGIGAEVVKMLLECDMEVIIACRKPSAGGKLIETIRASGVTSGKAKVMILDNSSLESVRNFAANVKSIYRKLDVLVNNAGVMFTDYKETNEGFEEQYGVNYLSHFLLTVLLIPLLKNAGTSDHYSRVVNVSSCAHLLGDVRFEDINRKENFITQEAYAQSKLALILSTKSFARIFEENKLLITANAVHPGMVNTDLFKNSSIKYIRFIISVFMKNPRKGATPITFTAVSPQMEKKSGLYISNCREAPVNPLANNETIQDLLCHLSLKQVGLQNLII